VTMAIYASTCKLLFFVFVSVIYNFFLFQSQPQQVLIHVLPVRYLYFVIYLLFALELIDDFCVLFTCYVKTANICSCLTDVIRRTGCTVMRVLSISHLSADTDELIFIHVRHFDVLFYMLQLL